LWARVARLRYQLFAEGPQECFMKAMDARIAFIVDGSGNPSMTNCEPMNQLMIHPVRIIHRGEA